MRLKSLLFAVVILSVSVVATAFALHPTDNECVVKRNRDFQGEALYGYMNGGSDLYLEYGFVSLNVKDLLFDGHEYTIETFKMKDAFSAYGIYSIHIFKPLALDTLLETNGLDGFDALSKYQLQAAYGDTYYSIIFNDGEVAAKGAECLLLEAIAAQRAILSTQANDKLEANDNPEVENITTSLRHLFQSFTNLKHPYSGNLKFVRGDLGLGNVDDSLLQEYSEKAQQGLWIYEDNTGNQVVESL